jgi:nucleotide-binding universal stress UspA family protein
MKILVCTDGSKYSQKALEEASVIVKGCNVNEVAIIHVYEKFDSFPISVEGNIEQTEINRLMMEEYRKKGEKILSEALKFIEGKNIKARTILKKGHPADTIISVVQEEGFHMIVIGSRGLGGLKKLFLGSVSNAIIQEVKNCSVLVVK